MKNYEQVGIFMGNEFLGTLAHFCKKFPNPRNTYMAQHVKLQKAIKNGETRIHWETNDKTYTIKHTPTI